MDTRNEHPTDPSTLEQEDEFLTTVSVSDWDALVRGASGWSIAQSTSSEGSSSYSKFEPKFSSSMASNAPNKPELRHKEGGATGGSGVNEEGEQSATKSAPQNAYSFPPQLVKSGKASSALDILTTSPTSDNLEVSSTKENGQLPIQFSHFPSASMPLNLNVFATGSGNVQVNIYGSGQRPTEPERVLPTTKVPATLSSMQLYFMRLYDVEFGA